MNRRQVLRLLSAASGVFVAQATKVDAIRAGQVSSSDWIRLRDRLRGRLTTSGQAAYEQDRRDLVWNAIKPGRFPHAIVHAASDDDVREAVRFARQQDLRVAVRGGGHNWHNAALRQGGILIDLSALNRIDVDTSARRAVVQPGVVGADLIDKVGPAGLMFPVANAPQVGLSGFLLNGGLGRNYRVCGPSCASVEAVDIVDARGELIRANERQNADLFWAARGAGPGFFGVATRFVLRLHAMPRAMTRTTASYALADGARLGDWLTEIGDMQLPAFVACSLINGTWRTNVIAFADSTEEAREVLRPLDSEPPGLAPLSKNLHQPQSVEQVFGRPNQTREPGPRYVGDSMVTNASPREIIAAAQDVIGTAPAGSAIAFSTLAGPEGAALPDMAFSISGKRYLHAHALWSDPTLDDQNRTWVRRAVSMIEPLRSGRYVGEADLALTPDRPRECFSASAWRRLAALKHARDPDNRFYSFPTDDGQGSA